jgi:hypothetical protein
MNFEYAKIESIWKSYFQTEEPTVINKVIALLAENKISLRKKDGNLKQITISIPQSIPNAYVIGLRYVKIDGTPTEDHFLCKKSGNGIYKKKLIQYHPKRKLELLLPEYKGTHKQWVDFEKLKIDQCNTNFKFTTDVNTITYIFDNHHKS